jgi:methionyl-tRNA formyltransferase
MGVAALVEVADLVVAGKAPALAQYEPDATYEGIIRTAESQVHWPTLVGITYNLIRGCDPAPGAWTTHEGRKLFLYDAKKRVARTFAEVKGKKIGQVVAESGTGIVVHGQGGFIEVGRIRPEGGKKIAAAEVGVPVGAILGG